MPRRAHYGALAFQNSSSAAGITPCYNLTTSLQDLVWWFGLLALTCSPVWCGPVFCLIQPYSHTLQAGRLATMTLPDNTLLLLMRLHERDNVLACNGQHQPQHLP